MRYEFLASDFDGTIAEDGKVSKATLAALQRWKAHGRKFVLVTGRLLNDLFHTFPEYEICDLIVGENGALFYTTKTKSTTHLASAPPEMFVDLLRARLVVPPMVGLSIVAAMRAEDAVIVRTLQERGLDWQLIYNKEAVMVLPPGVDKGTGLRAAFHAMGWDPALAAGVGDAENDLPLLAACGFAVSVANGIPELQEHADLVTKGIAGAGVQELIDHLLSDRPEGSDRPEMRPSAS